MAIQIGVVTALSGEVTATAADGSSRTLQVSNNAYANDLISTGSDGAIEIEFADGDVMDLGRSSQAMLDSQFFNPNATTFAEVADEAVLTLDAGNDFLINGHGDDILSGGDDADISDVAEINPGAAVTPAADNIDDFSAVNADVVELVDVLSDPYNQIVGVEHNGHLQIQVSNSEGVFQLINVTTVAAADDVAAQTALDQLLNLRVFDDGMS